MADDKAVIFGGKSSNEEAVNTLYLFERGSPWKVSKIIGGNLADLPALDSHSLVFLNGLLYAFGGFEASPGFEICNRFLRIDLEHRKYDELKVSGSAPDPRMNFGYCLDTSSRLIIFGGAGPKRKFSDLYRFDFQTQQWSRLSTGVIDRVPSSLLNRDWKDTKYATAGSSNSLWSMAAFMSHQMKIGSCSASTTMESPTSW